MSSTRNPELQRLRDELSRTTVISEDFKTMILQWTSKALEWQERDIKSQKKKKAARESTGSRCRGLDPYYPNPRKGT